MFSATGKTRSAAWRISLGGTLAFALGSLLVFVFIGQFVERDIERRTDRWLRGELATQREVVTESPSESLEDRTDEMEREVPDGERPGESHHDQLIFMRVSAAGKVEMWVGPGDRADALRKVQAVTTRGNGEPFDVRLEGIKGRFRTVSTRLADGSELVLGLSSRDEHRVLETLRHRFLMLWLLNVALGFGVLFWITRGMLGDVRQITEAAETIGETDLSARVPVSGKRDEAAQLAATLNRMLGRIEVSMHQVHAMSGALAHDLRSPLTAVRAKLEMALPDDATCCVESEAIVSSIDEIDRITELLTKSLDVAEATADALRLKREVVELDAVLRSMAELYGPSFAESGLRLEVVSAGAVWVLMDTSLLHRMLANLFDNELKHVCQGSAVRVDLKERGPDAVLRVEDDGPGFSPDVRARIFEPRVKGESSTGHGLGLAFVHAVVGAHGGTIAAGNAETGGAWIEIRLPVLAN